MEITLNGSTRVYAVIGDPIAQVKSPSLVTEALQNRGINAVCIPAHVAPADLSHFFQHFKRMQNLDGLMITVPHKLAFAELCDEVSPAAEFLQAVNVARLRNGRWQGAMFDGQAQVEALLKNGAVLQDKKALLAGAGGAGKAIAYALLQAGVRELAILETDETRRDTLIQQLNTLSLGKVYAGSRDPSGFDVVVNATPLGMKDGDPLPFDTSKLTPNIFAGDVVTQPEITPWLAAARDAGCQISTGLDMFACVRDLMVDFLLAETKE